MRLLVVGSNGQLGREVRRCLEEGRSEIGAVPAEYAACAADFIDMGEIDIGDRRSVERWFSGHGPYDVVVNCAAMTDVDGCESREAAAYRANAIGPMNLAAAARATGSKLVQVSTDYVFAGDEPGPRAEDDRARPVSAYGRSKLAGEVLALDANPATFVVRTAWLYGYRGGNFVKTMLRLAHENGRISVVCDQVGSPTNANDLAHAVLALAATGRFGVYHAVGSGECSWFDLASAAVDAAGIPCEREPLTTAEYARRFPKSAPRPAHSALSCSKLEAATGLRMRPWRQALGSYMANLGRLEE